MRAPLRVLVTEKIKATTSQKLKVAVVEELFHLLRRGSPLNRSLKTHIEREQAGEDPQALDRRAAALAAQPKRLKVCVYADPGFGGNVAQALVQLRQVLVIG